ncbi:MAG: transcriptional regulator [Thiohalomonadaceae bacterium]
MALTRDFRETVQARVARDATFRRALLADAVNELLAGDLQVGKSVLRDYVNATIGFEALAAELGKPSKSLQRMLGASGNPTAENLLAILKALQERESVQIRVKVTKDGPGALPS